MGCPTMCRPARRAQSGWNAEKHCLLPAHWMHAPCACWHSPHTSWKRACGGAVHRILDDICVKQQSVSFSQWGL